MPDTDHAEAAPGDDLILPFDLPRADIRGRLARIDRTLDTILLQHRYPDPVSALVAEAVLLTGLIGEGVKLRWRLSLQIRGDGPVHLIATDYFAPEEPGGHARMRAYAGFDRGDVASHRGPLPSLLGRGVFGVTIDQGPDMRPYQGITPLVTEGLSACAETYFAQSEQLATRFHILAAHAQVPGAGGSWRAGGVMLQQLPEAGPMAATDQPSGEAGLMTADDVAGMGSRAEDWHRANLLLATVEEHELIGPHVAPETLLHRLFHEESPRVSPGQRLRFGCTCSADRVVAAMAQYSAKDIAHMTNERGLLTADCQFCSAHYEFDPLTLGFEAEREP